MEKYLNKPLKIVCTDDRVIYGVLSCVSKPYSIILQHGVCYHESRIDMPLQFHYTPQFAAKPFLVNLNPDILNAHELLIETRKLAGDTPTPA
jgi:small nuclear ribonucleoprotein (snRNP)-like protein